jgi:hypothetical protein
VTTVTTVTTTVPATRRPRLLVALACCAVATLAVTALAAFVIGGALMWLRAGGPATDRAMATLLIVIGLVFLGPPAVCMWAALVQLVVRPPRGATIMLGCLRAVAGLVLTVALPVLSLSGQIVAIGAVAGIGLAFLAVAQLLASATRSVTQQGL